jgi:hypothetical protein
MIELQLNALNIEKEVVVEAQMDPAELGKGLD